MSRNASENRPRVSALVGVCVALSAAGCGLFEPRTPESPTVPGLDFLPPNDDSTVIANLESAVVQKNESNYIRCFADPATTSKPFTFVASSEGLAQYGSIFSAWTRTDERNYFLNLISHAIPVGASNLELVAKAPPTVTADSVVRYYDYVFVFQQNQPSFPDTARGSLMFTLAPDNNGQWMIFRWVDFKTGPAISWSMFKGKFSS